MRWLALTAVVALCACGDSNPHQGSPDLALGGGDLGGGGGSGGGDLAGAPGDLAMGSGGSVPDPGTMGAGSSIFLDSTMAANDQPSQATPIGSATGDATNTILVWVTNNSFTATDTSDYFVFKNGGAAATLKLGSGGVCASAANVLAKIDLWKVVSGQQQLPPVQEWTAAAAATCIPGTAPLDAGATYLVGFFGTGTAGSYSA